MVDPDEANKVLRMLSLKYPEQIAISMPMPTPEDVRIFRVTPTVISVLDYTKDFGHTDPVTCRGAVNWKAPARVTRHSSTR